MRNLKRALSLALASVMVLGLMVVGSGASYADVTSEENQEAIEVLQAVGVMVGDDEGNFNPDKNVTRNEMAVVMSNLLDLKVEDFNAADIPFTDVPSWAVAYVAACYADGITSGTSATTYGGSNTVTAAQAALMMMKALGYFQYQGDFEQDWTLATIKKGSEIGIFDGITVDRTSPLTRNDVAQMALNALKSNMVTFTGEVGIEIPAANGNVVVGYNPEYTARTSANSKYNSIDVGTTDIASNNQYYVQLGEELYDGDLELSGDIDVFGRPANYWEYDGKEVGTYVNYGQLEEEYTTEVTSKDLYDLLGKSTLQDYDLYVYIDGEDDGNINDDIFAASDISKNDKTGIGGTGNGTLTQVFVDTQDKKVTIAIINTYLAIAEEDYDEKKEEASFEVHNLDKIKDYLIKADKSSVKDVKVAVEDFPVVEDVVDGEAYLVTVAEGEVQSIVAAEVISDTEITAFKKGSNVTVDGTKYSYAETADYDVEVLDNYTSSDTGTINLKDLTYNVYLDKYGYAIGVDLVETPNNYLFITGVDTSESALGNKTAKASAIFLDGTMETIDINWSKSELTLSNPADSTDAILNTWCTYTVNNNGVYTVKEVVEAVDDTTIPGGTSNDSKVAQYNQTTTVDSDDPGALEINKKNIALDGRPNAGRFSSVYGNDATIYLTAELAEIDYRNNEVGIIDDVANVTTGVKNANLTVWSNNEASAEADDDTPASLPPVHASGVYTLYKSNGYIIAAVVVGEDDAASKNLVYTHTDSVEQESYDKTTDEWTWTRKVIMNGEETELVEVSDSLTYLDRLAQYGWYQVSLNAEGEVIGYKTAAAALDKTNGNAKEYLTDYEYIELSVNEYDTVLYTEPFTATAPWMRGSVLYMTRSDESGFFVAEDANIVLFQTNKNKEEVTFEVGADELENIVDKLNKDYNNNFDYTISAVIEDGAATTVIIRDEMNNYQRPTGDVNAEDYTITYDGTQIKGVVYYYSAPHDDGDILDAIVADLTDKGYTNFKLSHNSGVYGITCTDGRGIEWTFSWDESTYAQKPGVKLSVNGKGVLVEDDTRVKNIPGMSGTSYTKVTFSDNTFQFTGGNLRVANDGLSKWDGAVLESGYYEVTFSGQDTSVHYVKPGQTIRVTIAGDWAGNLMPYETTANGFTFSNKQYNNGANSDFDMTAPSTLAGNVTVNISYK